MLGAIVFIGGIIAVKIYFRWRRWKEATDLSSGKFLKYYMYSSMIVKPKRTIKRMIRGGKR